MSDDLVAQLRTWPGDQGLRYRDFYFRSAKERRSADERRARLAARDSPARCGQLVHVDDGRGRLRLLANARDFRHGAAVNQVQQGIPLSEVSRGSATPVSTRPQSTQSWPAPNDAGWPTECRDK